MTKTAERTCVTFRSDAFGVALAAPDETGEIADPGRSLVRWLSQELPEMGATCDHAPRATATGWDLDVHRGSAPFRLSIGSSDDPGEGPRWRIDVASARPLGMGTITEKGRLRVLSMALCVDALLRTRSEIEDIRWHPRQSAAQNDWNAWARLPDLALATSTSDPRDTPLLEKIAPLLPATGVRTRGEMFTVLVRRWKQLEEDGPLAHIPEVRCNAGIERLGHSVRAYAALYPPETADSLIEFIAFISYISSIERDLIRIGTSSLENFAPDTADVGARRLVQRRDGGRVITGAASIRVKLEAQALPDRFAWVLERDYSVARVRQNEADIALYARAPDGWLSLFATSDES